MCRFLAGSNLIVLESDLVHHVQIMEEYNRKTQAQFAKGFWKLLLTLTGRPHDSISLDTDNSQSSGSLTAKVALDMFTRLGLLYMGDFKKCANLAWQDGNAWQKAAAGHLTSSPDTWASALSYVAAAQHGRDKFRHGHEAKHKRKTINRWIKQGLPSAHWEAFLDAEYKSLKTPPNQSDLVTRKYRVAVDIALEGGYIQDAALASERWGQYLFTVLDQKGEAVVRLKESMQLFAEWGAAGKVDLMKRQYADIF